MGEGPDTLPAWLIEELEKERLANEQRPRLYQELPIPRPPKEETEEERSESEAPIFISMV